MTGLSSSNNSASSSSQFLVSGNSGGSGANSGAALAALSAKRLRGGNGLALNVVAHQVIVLNISSGGRSKCDRIYEFLVRIVNHQIECSFCSLLHRTNNLFSTKFPFNSFQPFWTIERILFVDICGKQQD